QRPRVIAHRYFLPVQLPPGGQGWSGIEYTTTAYRGARCGSERRRTPSLFQTSWHRRSLEPGGLYLLRRCIPQWHSVRLWSNDPHYVLSPPDRRGLGREELIGDNLTCP